MELHTTLTAMHRNYLDSIHIGSVVHHHKREVLKHALASHPSKHGRFGTFGLLQNALNRSKGAARRCEGEIPNERGLHNYENEAFPQSTSQLEHNGLRFGA